MTEKGDKIVKQTKDSIGFALTGSNVAIGTIASGVAVGGIAVFGAPTTILFGAIASVVPIIIDVVTQVVASYRTEKGEESKKLELTATEFKQAVISSLDTFTTVGIPTTILGFLASRGSDDASILVALVMVGSFTKSRLNGQKFDEQFIEDVTTSAVSVYDTFKHIINPTTAIGLALLFVVLSVTVIKLNIKILT
jgi:hypothetical protein